jgi:hypothetical protein
MTPRRVLLAKAVALGVVALAGAVSLPAQAHADTFRDHFSSPTAGVTCDQQEYRQVGMANFSWRFKCSGKPVGFSRGYQYREKLLCDGNGAPYWNYGPWKVDGSWSVPLACPDLDAILQHVAVFNWT